MLFLPSLTFSQKYKKRGDYGQIDLVAQVIFTVDNAVLRRIWHSESGAHSKEEGKERGNRGWELDNGRKIGLLL